LHSDVSRVSMSCVLNTMSSDVCTFVRENGNEALVLKAQGQARLGGFNNHAVLGYLAPYREILKLKTIEYLRARLLVDRGSLQETYLRKQMPPSVVLEDQMLEILVIL